MVDADLDGRKDLLIGEAEGNLRLYRNINTDDDPRFDGGTLLEVGAPGSKMVIDVGQRATPFVIDWDNDGRRDIVIGAKDGLLRLFINEGTDASWAFISEQRVQEDGFDLLVPTVRSSPHVTDIDGDEKKDLIVGNTEGQVLFYRNLGSDGSPAFSGFTYVEAGSVPIDLAGSARARPFVCDWTGDGLLDLLVGGSDGLVHLYQGIDNVAAVVTDPIPAAPDWLLFPIYPNPFNPVVNIPFELRTARRVRLDVFDSSGRHMAALVDGIFPAGSHRFAWRGVSGDGGPLNSGIYYIRLEVEGSASTKKAVLLR